MGLVGPRRLKATLALVRASQIRVSRDVDGDERIQAEVSRLFADAGRQGFKYDAFLDPVDDSLEGVARGGTGTTTAVLHPGGVEEAEVVGGVGIKIEDALIVVPSSQRVDQLVRKTVPRDHLATSRGKRFEIDVVGADDGLVLILALVKYSDEIVEVHLGEIIAGVADAPPRHPVRSDGEWRLPAVSDVRASRVGQAREGRARLDAPPNEGVVAITRTLPHVGYNLGIFVNDGDVDSVAVDHSANQGSGIPRACVEVGDHTVRYTVKGIANDNDGASEGIKYALIGIMLELVHQELAPVLSHLVCARVKVFLPEQNIF